MRCGEGLLEVEHEPSSQANYNVFFRAGRRRACSLWRQVGKRTPKLTGRGCYSQDKAHRLRIDLWRGSRAQQAAEHM